LWQERHDLVRFNRVHQIQFLPETGNYLTARCGFSCTRRFFVQPYAFQYALPVAEAAIGMPAPIDFDGATIGLFAYRRPST